MIFLLVFLFLLFFSLGVFFSSIDVKINQIEITVNEYNINKSKLSNLDINIIFKWFSVFKLLNIGIHKSYVKINGIRLALHLKEYKIVNFNNIFKLLKQNEMFCDRIKNLKLNFKFSTENAYATALLYSIISILSNNLLSRYSKLEKDSIEIVPYFYNTNTLKLSLNCYFVFSLTEILRLKKQFA